jgi:hypothetical protein
LPSLPAAAAELVDTMLSLTVNATESPLPQVIHSDLAGNVLLDDGGLPPAVIDVSLQFRSVPYAEAIFFADAVAWNGAPIGFVEQFVRGSMMHRAGIARAVVFRVVTAALFTDSTAGRVIGEAQGYRCLLPVLVP